jgi:hypothetical protein
VTAGEGEATVAGGVVVRADAPMVYDDKSCNFFLRTLSVMSWGR